MSQALEKIIKDIYALDPALAADDFNVREIVSLLSQNKPVIAADPSFVAELRTKLLLVAKVPSVKKQPMLSPWLMYLTPFGVAAVFVLLLLPKPLTHPGVLLAPVEPAADFMEESVPNEMRTFEAINAKQTSPAMGGAADTMSIGTEVMPAASDYFSVGVQSPGQIILVEYIEVSEPSFLVIQKNIADETPIILGISEVFYGAMEQVGVPIPYQMKSGETLEATLYRDNGDGIFTPGKDYPVYNASQNYLLQQFFTVI